MKKTIQDIVARSIAVKQLVLADEKLLDTVGRAVTLIVAAFRAGHRVNFCGNGGSASDAQHLAAEFSGRFYSDRHALPSDALHANPSYLTAVANDYSYDEVYARLVRGTMKSGDVLVGLSTSGNSKNIVAAFECARTLGITTIGFTGDTGGNLAALSDLLINIPSKDTPRIQESHILLGHIICELVEKEYFA